MDKLDEHTLMYIKHKLCCGSVKLRSGSNTFRYRLHHKEGLVNLINRINGNIRNSKRIPQLIKVCSKLNIPYVAPYTLTINNA
jgi:ubiquinol-cytochrome c reductase cytochrome b subunit